MKSLLTTILLLSSIFLAACSDQSKQTSFERPKATQQQPTTQQETTQQNSSYRESTKQTEEEPEEEISSGPAKPKIIWKPIKFDYQRKRDMAAYSKRHYGTAEYKLTNPKVIVEHMTAGYTWKDAWSTFNNNQPNLGEMPGTCTHFIIEKNGKIYQPVSLKIRCRHAVGMNWTAIGIEHVGADGSEVLSNPKMLKASLALTRWLQCRYNIKMKNTIGHNESLQSPYHKENVAAWKNQTHADWPRDKMRKYRSKLKKEPACPSR